MDYTKTVSITGEHVVALSTKDDVEQVARQLSGAVPQVVNSIVQGLMQSNVGLNPYILSTSQSVTQFRSKYIVLVTVVIGLAEPKGNLIKADGELLRRIH